MKRSDLAALLFGASIPVLAQVAHAQDAPAPASETDDAVPVEEVLVVTARLQSERVIDVPATVTGISSDDLQKLNVLSFEEINTVVPALNIAPGPIGSDAAVAFRGVQFDAGAQTSNTVTAYINEVPTNFMQLMNSLYDVGHIEVLRGPQGTLRGQSAPSGAVGLVTRRPDLSEFGGYSSATYTSPAGYNLQGAFGGPIIPEKLGLRVAAAFNRTNGNRIESANNASDPYSEGKNFRATALFRPTDAVEATLIYRHDEIESETYGSAVFGEGAPAAAFPALELVPAVPGLLTIPALEVPQGFNGPSIGRNDDLAVQSVPDFLDISTDSIVAHLAWSVGGHRLFYVTERAWTSGFQAPLGGDTFNTRPGNQSRGFFDQEFDLQSHEIRLSSEEPIRGVFDYTAGYYRNRNEIDAAFTVDNVFAFNGAFGSPLGVNTPSQVNNDYIVALDFAQIFESGEDSVFVNFNFYLGERTELSLGGRKTWSFLSVASPSGVRDTFAAVPFAGPCTGTTSGFTLLGPYTNAPLSPSPYPGTCNVLLTETNGIFPVTDFPLTELESNPFLWSASLKYELTPDLIVYGSAGTAFRPGPAVVGAPACNACGPYNFLEDEESTGYEIGLKGQVFDRRLTFSVAAFYQTFDDFVAQSETLSYLGAACEGPGADPACSISSGQFVFNAPIKTQGVDVELNYQASRDLSLGAAFSYAKSRFRDAEIPCADSDFDGVPDGGVAPTSLGAWLAAGGPASGPALCVTDGPTASVPPWNLIVRGEYSHDVFSNMRAFLRGNVNYTPRNTNFRLANPDFVPDKYAVADLFIGLRSADAAWEVSLSARNLFDDRTVLNESDLAGPFSLPPFSIYGLRSGYQTITRVPERSFQLSARYAFGSR